MHLEVVYSEMMASCLALAALALTNMAACGNKSGCCKVVISVDTTCCSSCFSKALVLFSRVANAVMDLCFLSAVKQDGRLPNLASKSGRCSCQCHFLIMPMPKSAWMNDAMACSAAASNDALVVALCWVPAWHWSMRSAMAKKAVMAGWHRPLGITTFCKSGQ